MWPLRDVPYIIAQRVGIVPIEVYKTSSPGETFDEVLIIMRDQMYLLASRYSMRACRNKQRIIAESQVVVALLKEKRPTLFKQYTSASVN
jgi:hypothetical protein